MARLGFRKDELNCLAANGARLRDLPKGYVAVRRVASLWRRRLGSTRGGFTAAPRVLQRGDRTVTATPPG